ncbi:MAG: AAA family ATPase [Desulfuromonadales bacterium]
MDKKSVLKIVHRGCGDIFSNPPPKYAKWLLDAYIRERVIAIVAGHGESGKGIFCEQLAACVASKTNFLGREVQEGKVLFLSAEDDEEEQRARLFDIAKSLGIKEEQLSNLEIRSTVDMQVAPTLFDDRMQPTVLLQALIDYCNENTPALLVLDTFSAFGPVGDVTQSSIVTKFMTTLAAYLPTTILFTLHLRKPNGKGKEKRPDQHDIRDSSAIVSSSRSALILFNDCLTLPKCNGRHRAKQPVRKQDELHMTIENGIWVIDSEQGGIATRNKRSYSRKGATKCDHLPEQI